MIIKTLGVNYDWSIPEELAMPPVPCMNPAAHCDSRCIFNTPGLSKWCSENDRQLKLWMDERRTLVATACGGSNA